MQHKDAGSILLIRCNKIISLCEKPTDENLVKLSSSIRKHGILQPITVRPVKYGMYEIISGERRFIASKLAGFSSVPCIVINTDEKTSAIMKFIENTFRKQLSLFDEADIIKTLILDHKLTFDEISDILSCDISDVIDKLKLLHFSHENMVKAKNFNLTFNQCKSLLKLEDTEFFDKTLDEIIASGMNDFQTEEYVKKILKNKRNSYIFKDVRIFTKTISNAVEKLKSSCSDVFFDVKEDDKKIEYNIVISKENNSVIRSL